MIFIFIIWFIFAYPYFLKEKVPFPSTYQVNNFAPWSAYEKFWGPVKNGAMPDIITQIYPWRHLAIEAWKSGQVPLWNPYSFSGTPLLANYQSAVFSPFNILFFIFPFINAWSILVLIQPLLAGIFMYIFARSLSRSKIGSLIASISFMFCGFITAWMGYATLAFAILFLPFSLFCIEKYYQTDRFRFLLFLAVSVPFSFFSGHFQISLYFLLAVIFYIAYKFSTTRNIRSTLLLILYTFFGLFISMPQLLPSIELYAQSFRSLVFAKSEVIPWGYISTFLAPDFLGNPVTRNDWFGHYAEWNAYIGVLPLMLAFYSISGKKKSQTIFLFIPAISVLFLAFASPVQDFFVNLRIPVLSSSAASRIIVLYSFLFAVLSSFGFDQLIKDIRNKNFKKIVFWLLSFSLIFAILWIVVGLKIFIPENRIAVAKSNLILPTLIFGVGSMVILFASFNKKLLVLVYLLLFIVSFDMLRFAIKWMPFDPKDLVFPDTTTTKSFSKISGYNRVLGNFGGEAFVYYKLPSAEGYDALYSKRYGQLIRYIEKSEFIESGWSVVSLPKHAQNTKKAINLLDIKYIVHKLADNGVSWTFPFWTYPEGQFSLIYKDDKYEFYQNNNVFPHAFLVSEYRVIKDKKQILETIFSNDFNLRKEIVVEEDPGIVKTEENVGETKILDYKQNKIEISVDAKNKALLFLSDNYYSGWKARVDEKEVRILKADYAFRAVPVEAGRHTVRFYYDPGSFRLGIGFALVGLIGIVVIYFVSRIGVGSR